MDFLHVVGARPNFPKLAPVYHSLKVKGAAQYIVHTGQHFEPALSEVLFQQLGLPAEDLNLGVGAGSHAQQTASVMEKLEQVLLTVKPRTVVVYGDVNSTVAATLVAAKLGIRVAHVEAGLRSGDRTMPEELNRLVTDVLCDLALTTSLDANDNLIREGRDPATIHFVGNPMIDSLRAVEGDLPESSFTKRFGARKYGVVTLHRPSNVDSAADLATIVDALLSCAGQLPLVFPVHPRRRKELESSALGRSSNIVLTGPLPYLEFLGAVKHSGTVITDSGGVQEETTAFGVPCLTIRPNTERPVTITHGTNQLVTAANVVEALKDALADANYSSAEMPPLWDGAAGPRIATALLKFTHQLA